ncbi:helix-turn-helix transcriptional regulator [Paenibacillus spongiae]|uniref:Helix-turn-helix domain-containing protein n=1 Tax=Paenibacillus spongiae TaxID=2909671 RepID=A0ABY5S9L6_9BACL|nr:DnaA N-terminal domain-containing protein [Paenibacillus spongiae]UVI29485.1 helix-turn-helix domain-containing protein [Paenibacillus spongiae]
MLDNKQIGKRILIQRKGLKLTQAELADQLSVSHQAVSKWENGECLPDIELLLRMARMFRLTVEELLLDERLSGEPAVKGGGCQEDGSLLWTEVLENIKKQLSTPSYNTWFRHTSAEFDGDSLIVYSPTIFVTEWLYSRYASLIINTIEQLRGESELQIRFQTSPAAYSHSLHGGIDSRRAILE